jgi:transposase InsO family protein
VTERIKEIHTESGGVYGSPRVHAVLKREGVHVGRKRVERLVREADIAGVSPRRKGFTRRDPKATLAPDLVERDFTAKAPNRLWVTDLTMIPTGEGPLWLSAIRDAFSRRVVAWETSARADADLVLTTLEYALASREVEPGRLIHHADHGCQGGFNWSSQHLDHGGVGWDGQGSRCRRRRPGRAGSGPRTGRCGRRCARPAARSRRALSSQVAAGEPTVCAARGR